MGGAGGENQQQARKHCFQVTSSGRLRVARRGEYKGNIKGWAQSGAPGWRCGAAIRMRTARATAFPLSRPHHPEPLLQYLPNVTRSGKFIISIPPIDNLSG